MLFVSTYNGQILVLFCIHLRSYESLPISSAIFSPWCNARASIKGLETIEKSNHFIIATVHERGKNL